MARIGLGKQLSVLATVILALCPLSRAQQKPSVTIPETPHLEFVKEVVRELAAVEEIRGKGEKELKEDPQNPLPGMIHSGTLFKLELGADIAQLKSMHLNDPYGDLIPIFTRSYENKIAIWDRMVKIGQIFMAGPKDGVDYGKMAAELPELRGRLDYLDQTIFESMPLVAATLIDLKKTNSQGQADHLIITKAERKDLIDYIDTSFGDEINQKNPNYTVGSAAMIKSYLNKDFKSADDPWD